jgi:cytochrome oxidase Cu insertion factor (SCO1/SenC/PrrC family)
MKKWLLPLAVVCLAAGVLTLVTAASLRRREAERVVESQRLNAVVEPSPAQGAAEWMTEYALTERSGRRFHSGDLKGRVHVVNFFFSTCPSVCRMQSGQVQQLAADFGDEGVVFLSITCDPQNDTPAALERYASLFNADPNHWLFLTSSDLNYLRRVGAEVYQVPVDKQAHSERLVVMDRWGGRRGAFYWNDPAEMAEMRQLLHQLLAEKAPPAASQPAAGTGGDAGEPAGDAE